MLIKFLDGTSREFADLRGAYLRGADLRGASLSGANLRDADLGGANLSGANLRGANLRDAYLFNTTIITFQLGRHLGFYHEGNVQIGCEYHTLDHWLENVESIGDDNFYRAKDIAKYTIQLKALKLIEELLND
jgi:uncharacterized protein YjbI with pentapeptide repeats